MEQPPTRDNKEKIIRNKGGGLFILCDDDQYVGMYPASLSELLNCSLVKAKCIIDIIAEITDSSNLDSSHKISDTVYSLSEILPEHPDENSKNYYIQNSTILESPPLITAFDVADILEITYEFAKELYDSFYQIIDDDDSLDEFLLHVERYLSEYHDGTIPEQFTKSKAKHIPKNNASFDHKQIQEILKQTAPPELRTENFNQPITNKEFFDSLHNVPETTQDTQEQEAENTADSDMADSDMADSDIVYDAHNFPESPYFAETCSFVKELLDIDDEDVFLLLSSANTLASFLEVDDLELTETILTLAAQGDMQVLLETIGAKIDDIITDIQNTDDVNTNNEETSNITQEDLPEIETTDIDSHSSVEGIDSDTDANNTNELPDNLSDTLRLVFSLKERITAKSLVESFKLFGIDISQSLARFIIEEGGYGGNPPNGHRITDTEMVEKLIVDIESADSAREFIKIYLIKVNNDLKSMMSGD